MQKMIEGKNLSIAFDKGPKVLHDISVSVEAGEFVAVLGANGSGKSTFFNILGGLYTGYKGSISLSGDNLRQIKRSILARDIVFLTQDASKTLFYDLSVIENCMLWQSRFESVPLFTHNQHIEKYKDYLSSFSKKLVQHITLPVADLSGGEKQTLALALAFRYPPKLLLLDEHTSAVDQNRRHDLSRLLEEYTLKNKVTTMIITHDIEEAINMADRILIFKNGSVIKDIDNKSSKKISKKSLLSFF